MGPTNKGSHDRSLRPKEKRDGPASRQDRPILVPGKGRDRDELERLSLDGNDGRENLREDPKDGSRRRKGYRSGRTSHPIDLIVVCDVISDTEGNPSE